MSDEGTCDVLSFVALTLPWSAARLGRARRHRSLGGAPIFSHGGDRLAVTSDQVVLKRAERAVVG